MVGNTLFNQLVKFQKIRAEINRFITNIKASTFPFEISINFAAASAVPPVAIKSSIIIS